jgi:hypothetical protein
LRDDRPDDYFDDIALAHDTIDAQTEKNKAQ